MERQRVFKNVIIGVLVVCVVCLSVAFAAFSQALTIVGTAKTASASSNWNVKITSVSALGTTGYATGSADTVDSAGVATVNFTCDIVAPGDTCTLDGTISNLGSVKAKYTSVTLEVTGGTGTVSGNTYTDGDITVTLTPPTGWIANTTVLDKAGTATGDFSVLVSANTDATFTTATTYTITATFNFEQA